MDTYLVTKISILVYNTLLLLKVLKFIQNPIQFFQAYLYSYIHHQLFSRQEICIFTV